MAAVSLLLETKGLTRIFGGLTAVDNVDFALPPGEIHALIGPNGAGKTTFVGMISGRIEASAGSIWFDGHEISHLPAATDDPRQRQPNIELIGRLTGWKPSTALHDGLKQTIAYFREELSQ